MDFRFSVSTFVETLGVSWTHSCGGFFFNDKQLLIVPISIGEDQLPVIHKNIRTIFLWEDVWIRKNELIRRRLAGEIKGRTTLFARKCEVKAITKGEADLFFETTHLLGSARATYRYGLFYQGVLVAASVFSGMRSIEREGRLFQSSEWVRYASLPHLTVTGGMGKLLSTFVSEHHPDDVMSYADKEWSQGAAYLTLGFTMVGETPLQRHWLDPETLQRYPQKRYPTPQPHWKEVYGLGSVKYVKKLKIQ